ncbi:hypothetical protein PSN45_001438 [Yamadazyma tenuis]|uniref:Uncharacterized protein n=1 Tax=Candida tenuis (strain ATCC 10573 / BCRC 21748 / CBS 615 / JCM 9827 / NBRC 10315 / NRRL Y-1498 / VKM Y-70) TaxID=590646 RepID=G3BC27_CANTC|nr:uncharacterized protein CANTEDRAFT_137241 [Yamadazyma tenuis ATCC 10573]EGV60766.1 hypothetical protein CANTEDRAFT_137241 [Yamadazyma tenuis ATCC 10573]WEJ93961.1 hypothetical protein PSN45_001438 [Yamadazyma tenuis]
MDLKSFRPHSHVNFVDPSDLLVEQEDSQSGQGPQFESQVLNEKDLEPILYSFSYDGYDLDHENLNNSDQKVTQNDFRISTGMYFDVDKNLDDDCEEKKRKKFWFLPFSVDSSLMVDSNLVASNTGNSGGLFNYIPITGETPGEIVYSQSLEPQSTEETDDASTAAAITSQEEFFRQYGDDCDQLHDSSGSSLWAATVVLLAISSLVSYFFSV